MANKNIETLQKIVHISMPQFLADLNKNFAIIQNSPLFKGVLGDDGNDGNDGARGERGSRFLFVNINKFQDVFGREVTKGSDVNITFLNNKLVNFNTKKQLLQAFGVTELVDKDIVVLTDSVMLVYNVNDNIFEETGQAFNPENNFINNIEQTIEKIVKEEIENNPVIKNATNIFDSYATLGKNYADDNSALVTDKLLDTTVYSPYIKNYNNKVGIDILNHKFFGYTDEKFPIQDDGTMVFGSIKLFYQLLMNTIAVDGEKTLTSDYSIGVDNIPSLVLLQDTQNNGLMVGYKKKPNLKSFGSLYKNDQNELVLKSDTSKKSNEFSELKIHKNYMKYAKIVNFLDDLTVGKNLDVSGDIRNVLIQTGSFSASKKLVDLDLGATNGATNLNSPTIKLAQFKDYVLVTDASGNILKTFKIEKKAVPDVVDLNDYNIASLPNSTTNLLTSNYFTVFGKRFNSLSAYIRNNYWRKNQFNNGDIPDLTLSKTLTVKGSTNLADLLIVNKESSLITVKSTALDIDSQTVKMLRFKNVVLVTDINGSIISTYAIGTQNFTPTINATTGAIAGNGTFTKTTDILTSKYYNILVDIINKQNAFIVANYWRKNQFNDGTITDLTIKNAITITNPNLNVGGKFIVTEATTTTKNKAVFESTVTLNTVKSRVLVTDSVGSILNTYFVDTSTSSSSITEKTNAKNNQKYQEISVSITTNANSSMSFVKHNLITNVVNNITAVIGWVNRNFWRKDQFSSGEITDIKTATSLSTDGNFSAGDVNNRNISTSGVDTTIGRTNGKVNLRGSVKLNNYLNGLLFVDGNGDLNVTYKISSTLPKVSKTNTTNGASNNGDYSYPNMQSDYWSDFDVWVNGSATTKGVYNVEENDKNLLHGKHFKWIVGMFGGLARTLKNYYTKTEVDTKFRNMLPIGTVVDFYGKYSDIPDGWSICDGKTITVDGKPFVKPNLINKYTKGINGEAFTDNGTLIPARNCGDIDNGKVTLYRDNLPDYYYSFNTSYDGMHAHNYKDAYWIEKHGGYNYLGGVERVGGINVSRGEQWANPAYIYWRNMATMYDGSHNHSVQFSLNLSGKVEPITINPRSFGMYKIIKYK